MQTFTYWINTQCHVNPKCQYEAAWAPVFTHAVEATVGFLMDLNLSKSLSAPSVLSAAVGLSAGHAWSPQRRGSRGPPGPVGPALVALLPPVPAARLGARPGVHICREHLLLLQPLLGSRVRCCRLLCRNVLYSALPGCTPTPHGTQDSQEGKFKCI